MTAAAVGLSASVPLQIPQETVVLYWWITLVVGVVVIVVVGFLLEVLLRTARDIRHGTADIWGAGKLIANNTVHIPMLEDTTRKLEGVLKSAEAARVATDRIRRQVSADGGES